ncbi:hypothetical protein TRFO_29462 [Tritrichomonas foetus]|uniref:Glycoside hydrolase family 5 domain-containing protein n=1 Tax=Tritrichomonas foetus TaxID=1144522 RepID=A0A1J4JVP8_9EUKA|nr:hypothetical protein TRFO_29462 [Tritrichomonas foetus]|eukprot:OHT03217.1 hypothetical protein TRFO_29462 [Tritrichomonas foetus]
MFFCFLLQILYAYDVFDSPYGVCSHITMGELVQQPTIVEKIKEAGINWIRSDFIWTMVEWSEGVFNDKAFEFAMKEIRNHSMKILPIFLATPTWGKPAINHLDKWKEYVRRIVTFYQDEIEYWEVFNEPNLEAFWETKPNATDYTKLLKVTYETIKGINSSIKVVFAGLAGVPFDYMKECLHADADQYFDILNIHPYRGGLTSYRLIDTFKDNINDFLNLTNYNKSLWISEMGSSTLLNKTTFEEWFFKTAQTMVKNSSDIQNVGYLIGDDLFPDGTELSTYQLKTYFPGKNVEAITNYTNFNKYQMIVVPPSESFPLQIFNQTIEFVKNGGTLVFSYGIPLYYYYVESMNEDNTTKLEQKVADSKYRKDLRINVDAWWYSDVPEQSKVKYTEGVQDKSNNLSSFIGTRFFTDQLLKDGDKLIPIIVGYDDNTSFEESVTLIYDFNSDFTGNIIINSLKLNKYEGNIVRNEREQGIYISQNILLALLFGVEKFFNYEFMSVETDNNDSESFYGIVHKDLSEKPAFYSYKALTKARPAGSVYLNQNQNYYSDDKSHIKLKWIRPDGYFGYAFWISSDSNLQLNATVKGSILECFDHYGNIKDFFITGDKVNLTTEILYVIGPEEITLSRDPVDYEIHSTSDDEIHSTSDDEIPPSNDIIDETMISIVFSVSESNNGTEDEFDTQPESKKISIGAIVGITIAIICIVVVLALTIIYLVLRKKKTENSSEL